MTIYSRPTKIFSEKLLHRTWEDSRDASKDPGAPGIDWQFADKFQKNRSVYISEIRDCILKGTYSFQPLRPRFIPKPNSEKLRLIAVPTVRDRLVQRRINEYFVEKDKLGLVNDVSFGFIKGLKLSDAIDTAVRLRNSYPWALKTDIVSYFDRINRDMLIDKLRRRLGNHSLLPLLENVIRCEVSKRADKDKLATLQIKEGLGLRQGMPLSPLLSNFVLAKFDREIIRRKLPMVRYADDFVIFCNSHHECKVIEKIVIDLLEQVKHEIPAVDIKNSKTVFAQPEQPVEFLGLEIFRKGDGIFYRRIPTDCYQKALKQIEDFGDINVLKTKPQKLVQIIKRMTLTANGLLGSYNSADNFSDFESRIHSAMGKVPARLMSDIFGVNAVSKLAAWEKCFLGLDSLD